MGRLVYVTRNYKSTAYGGAKARVDIEDILVTTGAVNLGLPRTFNKSRIYDYFRNLAGIALFMTRIRRGDTLVLQYPVKKYYRLMCRWSHLRGAKTVSLIHDLGSFRRHRLTVDEENRKLALSDVIIPANDSTIAWLREHGCDVPMTPQVAWDYLLKERGTRREEKGEEDRGEENKKGAVKSWPGRCQGERGPVSVAFVGHLKEGRNGFLYRLPDRLEAHLYGEGAPESTPAHVHAHGFIHPEDFARKGEGDFGLIWYGPTLGHDTKGYIGEYIAYCNPHKLGLYMRAGKPVVIWRGAGAAPFVEREGIGITVESLEGLDRRLAAVTPEEYGRMRANVARVAALMARGHYFRSALRHAMGMLNGEC